MKPSPSNPEKLMRFEAFLGDKFIAWVDTPEVSITQTGKLIHIASTLEGTNYVTTLNLNLIPAYTIARD